MAAIKDPTGDEMRAFLRDLFGPELDAFDIEGAIYWFASDYHGGQWSNLYSVLSTSQFRPGPISTGPEPESMASDAYAALESEYAQR